MLYETLWFTNRVRRVCSCVRSIWHFSWAYIQNGPPRTEAQDAAVR